jgi:transporter family protein
MNQITSERAMLVGLATVSFGIAAVLRKLSVNKIHPFQVESISAVTHFLLGVVCFWLSTKYTTEVWNTKGVAYSIVQCFFNIIGAIAFMFALRGGNDVGAITSLISISPIITLMLSSLFLGEQPELKSMIGIFIVVIGVTIAAWK